MSREPRAIHGGLFWVTIEGIQFVNERRHVTLGMASLDRVLGVVHTPRKDRVRGLSARKASPNEEKKSCAQRIRLQRRQARACPCTSGISITIVLDDDIIETFRQRAEGRGRGHQTLINGAL